MEKLRSEINEYDKWNLTDLIKDDSEYQNIVAEIKLLVKKIIDMKGSIVKNSTNLYYYLRTSEELEELESRLYVYSLLYFYSDMQDKIGLNYKNIAENLVEDIGIKLSFVNSELMSISYDTVKSFINENKNLEKYTFLLEGIYRYQKYILSESEEAIIAEAKKAFGTPDDAFSNLDNVDISLGSIKDSKGKTLELNNFNYALCLSSNDSTLRKNAFKAMYKYFKSHINTISSLYLGSIKEDTFSSNVRGFSSALEESLYSDNINVEFYNNFIEQVHRFLPELHKYMRLRGKVLGYKNHMYDLYVDLKPIRTIKLEFNEAKKIILDALSVLGKSYVSDLEKAFNERWIDIYPNKYKRSGAYEWGAFGVHPFVSVNFTGNIDDVSTLAHELGHAMHTYYANKSQEMIYAGYPIFLAEIASTVNETLLNDYLIKHAKTKEEKINYIGQFLDRVRTTIYRQTMFAEFEAIMHEEYALGKTITAEELNNVYYELNQRYYGKGIIHDEEIKYEWARIPHFYTAFYVYKYATGLIAALSIASDILSNDDTAKKKYIEFLSAGGSDYPLNTLKKVGVDISDAKTIQKAFGLFKEKLNELEELIKE